MPAPVNALLEAVVRQRRGAVADAEAAYRAILDRSPGQPDACRGYGLMLLGEGRPAEAAVLLEAAAASRPDDTRLRLRLARAHLSAGDAERALQALDAERALHALDAERALQALDAERAPAPPAHAPGDAEAPFLRGTALNALGRWGDAAAALRCALRLRPDDAETHLNLGNALADLDRLPEALEHLTRAAALAPWLAEAHVSLGCALIAAGRPAEAVESCERAAALRPDLARAHWNIGVASLLAGDFARGWEKYEWRFRNDPLRRGLPSLPGPVWDGGDVRGRTIMVCAEQGLGDAIQFSRYLPLLAERGAKVLVACAPGLIPLLRAAPGAAAAVPLGGKLPGYDLWVDQMSLPRLFDTTEANIPSPEGWLAPGWRDQPRRARSPARPRVGLVWAGNPAHSNDRRRSLPRAHLAALREAEVEWVSLQAGPRAAEAADLGASDRSAELTDFAATARIVCGLDLVVSVDSSVAHLAGALGCPVWTLLPHAPDWRWMLGRQTTPWYASMRLLRQPAPGDWASVIERVVSELRGGARERQTG